MFAKTIFASALVGITLTSFAAVPQAQEKTVSVAAVQQLALADTLIAVGMQRKDPLLLIAAVRVRNGLTQEAAPLDEKITSDEDVLTKAVEFAGGREDVVGLVEDIKSEGSRGDYYTTSGKYCYTRGSATICN